MRFWIPDRIEEQSLGSLSLSGIESLMPVHGEGAPSSPEHTSTEYHDAGGRDDIHRVIVSTGVRAVVTEGEDDGKETRTWSDTSGRFKIEAEFHKLDGRFVVLKKADGKLVRIPKARLSKADQALVDRLSK